MQLYIQAFLRVYGTIIHYDNGTMTGECLFLDTLPKLAAFLLQGPCTCDKQVVFSKFALTSCGEERGMHE